MESKKRRMLDPGVIRGKETERGKEENVQLEKRGLKSEGKKKTLLPCNKVAMNLFWCFSQTHEADWCLLQPPCRKGSNVSHFTRRLHNLTLPLI